MKTRLRADTAPLPEYLFSRSWAGSTHKELIKGLQTASNGAVYARFFHFYPDRQVSLSRWLAHWIRKGQLVPFHLFSLFFRRSTGPMPSCVGSFRRWRADRYPEPPARAGPWQPRSRCVAPPNDLWRWAQRHLPDQPSGVRPRSRAVAAALQSRSSLSPEIRRCGAMERVNGSEAVSQLPGYPVEKDERSR